MVERRIVPSSAPRWTDAERSEPLRAVEADLRALLREVDSLKTRLLAAEEGASRKRRELFIEILSALDAFDSVLANVQTKEKDLDRQAKIWIGNFRAVRRVFARLLDQESVVQIEAPAGKAMPGQHQIIETRENLDLESGTILEEIEKGYTCEGEVLRKSKVICVKN